MIRDTLAKPVLMGRRDVSGFKKLVRGNVSSGLVIHVQYPGLHGR